MQTEACWQERLDRAMLLTELAELHLRSADFNKGKNTLLESLNCVGENPPDYAPLLKVLQKLAMLETERGELKEAERLLTRALELCKKHFGTNSMATAFRLIYLSCTCFCLQKYDNSEKHLLEALEIYRDKLGNINQSVVLLLMLLALCAIRQNKFEEAEYYHCLMNETPSRRNNEKTDRKTALSKLQRYYRALKEKSTTLYNRYGVLPGEEQEFPDAGYVLSRFAEHATLAGITADSSTAIHEETVKADGLNMLAALGEFVEKAAREKQSDYLWQAQENPDFTVTISVGRRSANEGIACIRLRISRVNVAGVHLQLNSNQEECSKNAVRGDLIPLYVQSEIQRGALAAFEDIPELADGILIDIIEAVEDPAGWRNCPYRKAGWPALEKFAKRLGMQIREDSLQRLEICS